MRIVFVADYEEYKAGQTVNMRPAAARELINKGIAHEPGNEPKPRRAAPRTKVAVADENKGAPEIAAE